MQQAAREQAWLAVARAQRPSEEDAAGGGSRCRQCTEAGSPQAAAQWPRTAQVSVSWHRKNAGSLAKTTGVSVGKEYESGLWSHEQQEPR